MKNYWLKFNEDFFYRDDIVILESMPNGIKLENILLKLLLQSIKNNFKVKKPYALKGHTEEDVEKAIPIFRALGILCKIDDGDEFLHMQHIKAGADL